MPRGSVGLIALVLLLLLLTVLRSQGDEVAARGTRSEVSPGTRSVSARARARPPAGATKAAASAPRVTAGGDRFAVVSTVLHRAPMWGWRVFTADRQCYTEKHQYTSIVLCEESKVLKAERQEPGWNKVWALMYALNHRDNYTWVLLIDDDVMISGKQRKLDAIVKEAGPGVHVILPQQGATSCIFSNYAMLVRNSPTGRRFAQMWWEERPTPPDKGCGYMDQCPMWRTILRMLHEEQIAESGDGKPFELPIWSMHGDGDGQRLKLPDMEFDVGLHEAGVDCLGKGQAQKIAKPFSFASANGFVLQSKIYEPWAQGLKPELWDSAFAMHTGPAINSSYVSWWNEMHPRACKRFTLTPKADCNNGVAVDITGLISLPINEIDQGAPLCFVPAHLILE